MIFCAALSASSIAPAQADPSTAPVAPLAFDASLPKVPVPELLDPQAEPTLSQPDAVEPQIQTDPLQTDGGNANVAETVTVKPAGDLSSMVAQLRSAVAGSRELECLATGVYFESKSEPLAGQLAVGKVIANRANSGGRFPPSYCGVLFQRGQFSFVHGRTLPSVPRSSKQWQTAVAIAKIVDQGLHASSVGNALFFHARYVSPGWRLKRVAAIGNHIFYR